MILSSWIKLIISRGQWGLDWIHQLLLVQPKRGLHPVFCKQNLAKRGEHLRKNVSRMTSSDCRSLTWQFGWFVKLCVYYIYILYILYIILYMLYIWYYICYRYYIIYYILYIIYYILYIIYIYILYYICYIAQTHFPNLPRFGDVNATFFMDHGWPHPDGRALLHIAGDEIVLY